MVQGRGRSHGRAAPGLERTPLPKQQRALQVRLVPTRVRFSCPGDVKAPFVVQQSHTTSCEQGVIGGRDTHLLRAEDGLRA